VTMRRPLRRPAGEDRRRGTRRRLSIPDYQPMLATPWPDAFDDDGWWFEGKWDGYRAIVGNDGGRLRARSRRGLDLLGRFPEVSNVPIPPYQIPDGAVTAFDVEGRPSACPVPQGSGSPGALPRGVQAPHPRRRGARR